MKKRLLVTGASGFLGWNVCTFPQKEWEIFGTYFQHKNRIPPNIQAFHLNENATNFKELLEKIKPNAILHLAAQSDVSVCEKNPETAKINVDLPLKLAKITRQFNIPFFFTSTEQVFAGSANFYLEEMPTSPHNEYGKQKAIAEKALLGFDHTCVIRLPCLYGNTAPDTRNFMNEWLKKWEKGEAVTAFEDEIRSFLSGQSAAEGLFLLLHHDVRGIYHIAGKEHLSRFIFAHALKEFAKLPHAEIIAKSQQDFTFTAYRPQNLTLYCEKIKKLGFQPKTLGEELEKLV